MANDSPGLRIYELNLNRWPTSDGFGLKCSRSILTRLAYGFSLMPCEVAIDLSIEQLDAPIEDTIWAFFFSFSVMLCATKLNSNRSSYSIQLSTLGENSSIILAIGAAILKYRVKINIYPRRQFMSNSSNPLNHSLGFYKYIRKHTLKTIHYTEQLF